MRNRREIFVTHRDGVGMGAGVEPAGRAAGISAARASRPTVVRRTNDYSGGIPHADNVCMRTRTCSALVLSIALLAAAPASIVAATPEHAVLRIHILNLRDRTVKLGFTMTGGPLRPFSATCTPGQALVSVRVNVLTVARPR
jgi:hypothetical protein